MKINETDLKCSFQTRNQILFLLITEHKERKREREREDEPATFTVLFSAGKKGQKSAYFRRNVNRLLIASDIAFRNSFVDLASSRDQRRPTDFQTSPGTSVYRRGSTKEGSTSPTLFLEKKKTLLIKFRPISLPSVTSEGSGEEEVEEINQKSAVPLLLVDRKLLFVRAGDNPLEPRVNDNTNTNEKKRKYRLLLLVLDHQVCRCFRCFVCRAEIPRPASLPLQVRTTSSGYFRCTRTRLYREIRQPPSVLIVLCSSQSNRLVPWLKSSSHPSIV